MGPLVEMTNSTTGSHRPSPPLGRHTREVLEEAGLAGDEIDRLYAEGAVASP